MTTLAPIAVFAYNRPEHLRRSLESLAACRLADESRLTIYCDGPKTPDEAEKVAEVRRIAASRQWCGQVRIVHREANLGLANSVMAGTGEQCGQYGRVIVVEDDLVLSPWFLSYMNQALDRFADEERVMQISGYMFPLRPAPTQESFFLPMGASWGWATWESAWRHFDPDMRGAEILDRDLEQRHRFNLLGGYDYYNLVQMQRQGRVDSWGVRWCVSMFLRDGLILYPGTSLVSNIGFDGSGRHCSENDNHFATVPRDEPVREFPSRVEVDGEVYARLISFLKNT
jgi:hypothetical protein